MKRRVKEEEEIGELNIIPYLDIVTNLVMFMLLSLVGLIQLGVLDVGTPKLGDPADAQVAEQTEKQEPSLTLTVGITDRGFYVAGAGGVLDGGTAADSGGAMDKTRPPTIPKKGNSFDYAGLTAMLGNIKERFPNEQRVILVAESTIPYEIVIQTMDACRERNVKLATGVQHQTLFAEVWLSSMQ